MKPIVPDVIPLELILVDYKSTGIVPNGIKYRRLKISLVRAIAHYRLVGK